jgi:hypothetical protein
MIPYLFGTHSTVAYASGNLVTGNGTRRHIGVTA